MLRARGCLALFVLAAGAGAHGCAGASPPPAAAAATEPPPSVLGATGEESAPIETEGGAGDAALEGAAAPVSALPITLIAKSLHASAALAVDANAVYWVDEAGGEVSRAPKRGGMTMTLFGGSGGAFSPGSWIAVEGGDVYWISDVEQGQAHHSALQRLEKNGGKPTVLAGGAARMQGLALDEKSVYWAQAGAVMRVGKDGAGQAQVVGGLTGADAVAVDDTDVYVTLAGTEAKQFADGSVVVAPKKGGAAKPLVAVSARAANVLVDGKNVYWQSAAGVMKVPKSGGPAVVLAPVATSVDDLALDYDSVYFATHTSGTDGAIARVPKEGGPVEVLVTGQSSPGGIAVDEGAVYWSCLGTEAKKYADGTIGKRDKK